MRLRRAARTTIQERKDLRETCKIHIEREEGLPKGTVEKRKSFIKGGTQARKERAREKEDDTNCFASKNSKRKEGTRGKGLEYRSGRKGLKLDRGRERDLTCKLSARESEENAEKIRPSVLGAI